MDISAIKKRLTQLQTTNTRTSNLWKPQPGKTLIRIVPYKFNKQTPFIDIEVPIFFLEKTRLELILNSYPLSFLTMDTTLPLFFIIPVNI